MDTDKMVEVSSSAIETVKTVEEIAIETAGCVIVHNLCPKNANIFVKAAFALTGWCVGGVLAKLNSERVDAFILKMLESMKSAEEEAEG